MISGNPYFHSSKCSLWQPKGFSNFGFKFPQVYFIQAAIAGIFANSNVFIAEPYPSWTILTETILIQLFFIWSCTLGPHKTVTWYKNYCLNSFHLIYFNVNRLQIYSYLRDVFNTELVWNLYIIHVNFSKFKLKWGEIEEFSNCYFNYRSFC